MSKSSTRRGARDATRRSSGRFLPRAVEALERLERKAPYLWPRSRQKIRIANGE